LRFSLPDFGPSAVSRIDPIRASSALDSGFLELVELGRLFYYFGSATKHGDNVPAKARKLGRLGRFLIEVLE